MTGKKCRQFQDHLLALLCLQEVPILNYAKLSSQ